MMWQFVPNIVVHYLKSKEQNDYSINTTEKFLMSIAKKCTEYTLSSPAPHS